MFGKIGIAGERILDRENFSVEKYGKILKLVKNFKMGKTLRKIQTKDEWKNK